MSSIIFTGVEELFNAPIASHSLITETVKTLQRADISLVPATSRTRAELEQLWQTLDLSSPLIVEQGSGVFIPQDQALSQPPETLLIDSYYLHQIGCSYTEARAALKAVQEEISKILRGFGDMDEAMIQSLVPGAIAHAAKAREFSEYFVTPGRIDINQLQQIAVDYGFQIFPEENLSLITGNQATIPQAMNWLQQSLFSAEKTIFSVGLGNLQQDQAILENVNQPIVIPSTGEQKSSSTVKDYEFANHPGHRGWIHAIQSIYEQLT